MPPEQGTRHFSFSALKPHAGTSDVVDRSIIIEAPIAIEYNGIGYAVMMATPTVLQKWRRLPLQSGQ
jgi:FdhD protein